MSYHFKYFFSSSDLLAISAALPLLRHEKAETAIQHAFNSTLAQSVQDKIESESVDFTVDELRIISCSVDLARNAFSPSPWFGYTQEDLERVRPYVFEYNRLSQALRPMMDYCFGQE